MFNIPNHSPSFIRAHLHINTPPPNHVQHSQTSAFLYKSTLTYKYLPLIMFIIPNHPPPFVRAHLHIYLPLTSQPLNLQV